MPHDNGLKLAVLTTLCAHFLLQRRQSIAPQLKPNVGRLPFPEEVQL